MVTMDHRPGAGGNHEQADDGRDPETGQLPRPMDAADWDPVPFADREYAWRREHGLPVEEVHRHG